MAPHPDPLQENLKTITNYEEIIGKYTPASLPSENIIVKFREDEYLDDSLHQQQKCSDLQYPFSATSLITASIRNAKILYDGPIGSKKFIELFLDFENIMGYQFNPGDTVGIIVSNSKDDVSKVLNRLQLFESSDCACNISIRPGTMKNNFKIPHHIPAQSSPRAIIRDCLELRSVLKKQFLRALAQYTTDEEDKIQLMALSSKEGIKLYNQMILEKKKTFIDILDVFPSCCPPLSLLIEHLPRLKPRPYSIANSPLTYPGGVRVILSVHRDNPGVATSFLAEKVDYFLENPKTNQQLCFYFRKTSKFYFEHLENTILIGIGCGVSPFIGFLEHKDYLMKQKKSELGSTWLFVGSKCQESAVHRDDLLDYKMRGILQHLNEGFSNDPECNKFKHVQDQLKANAAEFVEQITKNTTYLYVCADGTKISKSIEDCIKECLANGLECTKEDADIFIKEMRLVGRYREDVWV